MFDWFDGRDFANGLFTELIAMTIEVVVIVRVLEWLRRRETNRLLRPYRDAATNNLLLTLDRLAGILEAASVFVSRYYEEVAQQVEQISLNAPPSRQNPFHEIRGIAETLARDMAEKHHLLDVGIIEIGHAVMDWLAHLMSPWAAQTLAAPKGDSRWTYISPAHFADSLRQLPIAIDGATQAFFHAKTALRIARSRFVRNQEKELCAAAHEMRKLLDDLKKAT